MGHPPWWVPLGPPVATARHRAGPAVDTPAADTPVVDRPAVDQAAAPPPVVGRRWPPAAAEWVVNPAPSNSGQGALAERRAAAATAVAVVERAVVGRAVVGLAVVERAVAEATTVEAAAAQQRRALKSRHRAHPKEPPVAPEQAESSVVAGSAAPLAPAARTAGVEPVPEEPLEPLRSQPPPPRPQPRVRPQARQRRSLRIHRRRQVGHRAPATCSSPPGQRRSHPSQAHHHPRALGPRRRSPWVLLGVARTQPSHGTQCDGRSDRFHQRAQSDICGETLRGRTRRSDPVGGHDRIRTGVQGFAGLCLTTRPRGHESAILAEQPDESVMGRRAAGVPSPRVDQYPGVHDPTRVQA